MKIVYITLNKPVNYHVSKEAEPSIYELLDDTHTTSSDTSPIPEDLMVVNNLDPDSEGLIVLTNNQETTSSSKDQETEFEITIDDYLSKQALVILKKGMHRDGESIAGITIVEEKHKGKRSVVRIISHKNTDIQIRKMFEAIGYHVVGIRCIRFDVFKLGVLSIGRWKYAT
jgi:pseudouridine synthase